MNKWHFKATDIPTVTVIRRFQNHVQSFLLEQSPLLEAVQAFFNAVSMGAKLPLKKCGRRFEISCSRGWFGRFQQLLPMHGHNVHETLLCFLRRQCFQHSVESSFGAFTEKTDKHCRFVNFQSTVQNPS